MSVMIFTTVRRRPSLRYTQFREVSPGTRYLNDNFAGFAKSACDRPAAVKRNPRELGLGEPRINEPRTTRPAIETVPKWRRNVA